MNLDSNGSYYRDSWKDETGIENDHLVTVIFLVVILTIFILTLLFAVLIGCLKPQWFRLNIYQDPMPKMADCSCLNICLPCTSCSFRQLLNGCCPRLNLKQRFNCITTCCNRPGPDKLNLVCCVV